MKIRRSKNVYPLDISSLIDVLFILLIFLMLAVRFNDVDSFLPLDLPEAKESKSGSENFLYSISVLKTGEIIWNGESLTPFDFENKFPNLNETSGDSKIQLSVDKNTPFYFFISVTETLKSKGYKNVVILQKFKH